MTDKKIEHRLKCPLSKVEQRLADSLKLFVELKNNYFNPDVFRLRLNSCIETLRSVTWVLQKSLSHYPDFKKWYTAWQEKMRKDPILKWLHDSRNIIVKEGDLTIHSKVRIAVVESWFEPPVFEMEAPPFTRTDKFAKIIAAHTPPNLYVDPAALLRVERRWVDSRLAGNELLESLAHAFKIIFELLLEAHTLLSKDDKISCDWYKEDINLKGKLSPCMLAQDYDRTIWVEMKTGAQLTSDSFTIKRDEETIKKAIKRYPAVHNLKKDLELAKNLEDKARALFKQAKIVLATDGYHLPMAFIGYPDGHGEMMVLTIRDRAEKYLVFRDIASFIEKTGANSLILITEAWMAEEKEARLTYYALESPHRKEALQVIAVDSNDKIINHTVLFKKDGNGKVQFEGEVSSLEDIYFLEPIRKVWRKERSK